MIPKVDGDLPAEEFDEYSSINEVGKGGRGCSINEIEDDTWQNLLPVSEGKI